MREVLVRSLTSPNRFNRDCWVTEVLREDGLMTTVSRRCTYRVDACVTVPSTRDTIRWAQALDPMPPRQVYVRKAMDPLVGGERVIYKVHGHFYVVWDRQIFCVSYRHVLSMAVQNSTAFPETGEP